MFAQSLISVLLLLHGVQATWTTWNGTAQKFLPPNAELSYKPTADVSADVYGQLQLARSSVARLNLLAAQNNTDLFKFNFNPETAGATASKGAGGIAVLADRSTMPALIGLGVSMALGFLEPCGVNAPHFHPRSTQLVAVVNGGPLRAGAIWSNAATTEQFEVTVKTFEMVALPQGSIHWVFNDNCEPLVTANAFGSEDPGILNVAPTLFKMNPDILNGTLGWPSQLDGYATGDFKYHIPPSYVLGSEACLKRCGISKSAAGSP